MPNELRETFEQKAKNNARSMNAELVLRLEASLTSSKKPELLSAKEAKRLAIWALEDGANALLTDCIESINDAAERGYDFVVIDTIYDYTSDEVISKVVNPVKAELETQGYSVDIIVPNNPADPVQLEISYNVDLDDERY